MRLWGRLRRCGRRAGQSSKGSTMPSGCCNILKTPDIALNVLDVLDRLEVDYEVAGGTANCCGINFMRAGDAETSYAQASQTLKNMRAFEPREILSWCASCNVQMHDFVPSEEYHRTPMRHLTSYLWTASMIYSGCLCIRCASAWPCMSTMAWTG
ncbi:hypothetical protein C2W62_27560 [Candidatus Entotheonella serta]|nr:hypothetical protein C2W62_27560 [Candidatus Entotheonella serta]